MAEKDKDAKANPIMLAVLFAGILATLFFILMTGDYGESEPPIGQSMDATPLEIDMVAAVDVEEPEPEVTEVVDITVIAEPEAPPKPSVTEETADDYARQMIDTVNGGKALTQFVAGDYIVERSVAIIDALRRGEVPYKLLPVGSPSKTFPISDNGLSVTMDPAGFSRYDGFAQWLTVLM